MAPEIVLLTQQEVKAAENQIVAVYRSVFTLPPYNEPEENVSGFRESLGRYVSRPGFRCVVARDSPQSILGFACGYASQCGFWWYDTVSSRLRPELAALWFADGFEVVEIAVIPEAQGNGLGGQLHDRLLQGLPYRTALLQNNRDALIPLAMYRQRGWLVLAANFIFPGAEDSCIIMGRHLNVDEPS